MKQTKINFQKIMTKQKNRKKKRKSLTLLINIYDYLIYINMIFQILLYIYIIKILLRTSY